MKTAFVFPGQGSQSLGMLADIAQKHPQILDTFSEASDVLGVDLWNLSQKGPEAELNRTEITQPAMLAASVAVWRLWQDLSSVQPEYVAGHSLGEYSALVAAGVIEYQAAISFVHLRGKLMQSAVPDGVGAMAAVIGLDDEMVLQACEESAQGSVVQAVNFNSPGQVVIAGHAEAVERAAKCCKDKGARRVLPLPVSVPSHCELMVGAAQQLAWTLEKMPFRSPSIPIIQNVSASLENDPDCIRENLVRQLYSPVLWTQTMVQLNGFGVGRVVECGPGKVLSGLTKRCIDKAHIFSLGTIADLEKAITAIEPGSGE